MKAKQWLKFAAVGLALAALGLLVWFTSLGSLLREREALLAWLQTYRRWAPLITIGLHIVQVLSAPIPGTLIDTVNGWLFGAWLGTLYSMLGLTSGSWLAMLLARRYGRPLVARYVAAQQRDRLDGLIQKYGALVIFIIFLVPFLPDDAVCFLAGLTPIPLLQILPLVIIGRTPGVFFANWLGANCQASHLPAWQLGLAAAFFVIIAVLGWRYRQALARLLLQAVEAVSQRLQSLRLRK